MLDSYKEAEQTRFVGEILSNTLIKVGLHTQSSQSYKSTSGDAFMKYGGA
ncbi:hypothetical protein DB41_HP00030 [Neochlamydia sp. TUME1]|nr:hypothetical protein DB41_HP00030 [Neochlamydia sp. TUME1]